MGILQLCFLHFLMIVYNGHRSIYDLFIFSFLLFDHCWCCIWSTSFGGRSWGIPQRIPACAMINGSFLTLNSFNYCVIKSSLYTMGITRQQSLFLLHLVNYTYTSTCLRHQLLDCGYQQLKHLAVINAPEGAQTWTRLFTRIIIIINRISSNDCLYMQNFSTHMKTWANQHWFFD